ncbi:MAG: sulfite exporter TauE/SafE family protein [Betaproteobacteria bacterium]|nr:sulfite exporter TauE/SafE family protein [Betaproteobacteria bacterium]MDH3437964.1 sulfite exporter TauE/SafE family protein [Betaproteobacteria bacterium]
MALPAGLGPPELALAAIMVFTAFSIRGMSGFGAGMVGIPLLAFVMPVHTAVPMFSILVLTLFVFISIRDWKAVVRDELRRLILPTLLGVVVGIVLLQQLDNQMLLKLLGGLLIAYASYATAVQILGLPQVNCSQRWAFPVGFVGAVIDTIFSGGGGTLVVIYLHMRGVGRQPFRATVAVVWLVEMVARMAGYGAAGYYTMGTLLLCLLLLPMMWAGTYVGERIGNRISQDTFSKVLSALLALTGVMLILK